MKRLLPALLFAICVVAPNLNADTIYNYVVTETTFNVTLTSYSDMWLFSGPQTFTMTNTFAVASFLPNPLLSYSGYDSTGGAATQSATLTES